MKYIGLAIILMIIIGVAIVLNSGLYLFEIKDATSSIDEWFYCVNGAATAVLAVIAWHQVGGIQKSNETGVLLRIDERWSSEELIEARTLIYNMYLEASVKTSSSNVDKFSNSTHSIIGRKIIKMSSDNKKCDDFIYIINLLDFMETIGYLQSKDHIHPSVLDALCGEDLRFNYRIFESYIFYKRKKNNNNKLYRYFENLYNALMRLDEAS